MDKPPGRAGRFLKPHSLGDPSAYAAWRLPADMRSSCPSRNGCLGLSEVSTGMGMCAGDGVAAAREGARGGAGRLPDPYLEKYEGPEWRIWAAPAGGAGGAAGAPRPGQPMCYAVISPGLACGCHRLELRVEHVPGGPHSVARLAVWVVRHLSCIGM